MHAIPPERLAWALLNEAEAMHFVISSARQRAFVGRWTPPQTVGDFLGLKADSHETDALESPDEAGRHDVYALRLRDLIGRLRELGCRPTRLPDFSDIGRTRCIIAAMAAPDKNSETTLPPDSAWLFPEYNFGEIGLESHFSVIVERVLERGSWEQVRWLFATYGEPRAADWVRAHGFRLLSKRSFAFWRLVLGIADFQAPSWAREAKAGVPW